ncbi:MAG: methyltransferase family protein [Limisphaerales bacterium]
MNEDHSFRLVLLPWAVSLMLIAAYHRLRAHTGEKLDRRQEGIFILVTLRLAGVGSMLGLIAYLVNPAWMAWAAVPLPDWLRWAGAGIGVAAAVLIAWTLHHLGRNLTDTVVTRQRHTLVTTGPYRWVRHPFYSSVALAALAGALMAANAGLLITGGLLFLLMAIRARKEEMNLLARFGDDYRKHMRRTGRFIPRWPCDWVI